MISLVAPKRNEVIEHCQMFQARRDGLVNPAAQRVLDAEARDLDYTYDPPAHHYAPDRLLRLPKDRDFKVIGVVNQRLKPVPQITVTITSGETSGVFHQHIYGYDCMGGVFIWPNRDPFEENGGLNLYAYVLNNPINTIDPYGLQMIPPGNRPPDSTHAPSGNGGGNGPSFYPTHTCIVDTYTDVVRYTKPCPKRGTTTCYKWSKCISIGNFPTTGVSGDKRNIGIWVKHERCDDCHDPCK